MNRQIFIRAAKMIAEGRRTSFSCNAVSFASGQDAWDHTPARVWYSINFSPRKPRRVPTLAQELRTDDIRKATDEGSYEERRYFRVLLLCFAAESCNDIE